jgi:hypothetical protein
MDILDDLGRRGGYVRPRRADVLIGAIIVIAR